MIMNIYNKICNIYNIYKAYRKATKGRYRYTNQALDFGLNVYNNLINIQQELINNNYTFGDYMYMVILDNKRRDVFAPCFRDKILHHAINNVLSPELEKGYIKDSYSCIRNKGNKKAVLKLQQYLKEAIEKYGKEGRYLTIDISKFFYTINKKLLKERLTLVIKDNKLLNLLFSLLDSFQKDEVGLPLGNLTSQQFANYYMDYIDKYIKRTLGIKYYVRYADDMFLILPNKDIANKVKKVIINKLETKLKLVVNPKKCSINTLKFIPGLGYRIYANSIALNNKNKRTFKKYLKKYDIEKLNGWYSYACTANCKHFIKKQLQGRNIIFYKNRFIKSTNYKQIYFQN